MYPETIQLEKLRQKIEDVSYEAGDRSDYLDRGKPNAAEAKKTQEYIKQLGVQEKALQAELKQLIANVRSVQPQAFEEWVNYHTGILQKILNEKSTDTHAKTRLFVAKQTIEEWEKVRAGEQEYVNINWFFLKNYKAEVRKITGGRAPKAGNTSKAKSEDKAWWQFWK